MLKIGKGVLNIDDQSARSVRVIKFVNNAVPAKAPTFEVKVGGNTDIGQSADHAVLDPAGVPAIGYHWNFGDGTTADSVDAVQHAYTRKGNFQVALEVDGLDGVAATQRVTVTVVGSLKNHL